MLILSVEGQNHESLVESERLRTTTLKMNGDEVLQGRYDRLLEEITSLPKARKKKILAVRYKLDTDIYKIDEKLNIATDRLIEDLITNRMEEDEVKRTTRRRYK